MNEIRITTKEKVLILQAVKIGYVTADFLEYCKVTAKKEITGLTDAELEKRLAELNRKLE